MDQGLYAAGHTLPGTVYRVVRHLATGGMGSVYDVEDETVGKRYVLKTLHPNLIDRSDLAARMREEAKTLGMLQHPNIVDVITAGVTKEARAVPYYVMERLNGNNLRLLLDKKGSLELLASLQIAIDVADALEHAHDHRVIHRDVKPENIFLHRNANGKTTTKLLDFGIMRLLDRKASHTHGKFIGTLRYASPEQIEGRELGPQTDIYSLGLVLYEMLCGRGPFDDLQDQYQIGMAHAQRPPPRPTQFAPVPAEIERVVMWSLAKDPRQRPPDCFSFGRELLRFKREYEAAPRSATQVNAIAVASDTRASPPSAMADPSQFQKTELGMPPPSMVASTRVEDPATAPTVASEPGRPPTAVPATPVMAQAQQRPPGWVDRAAETRAAAEQAFTQRVPQHGTLMDDADAAIAAAFAERAPLEVPPITGPSVPSDPVFPRSPITSGGTGPLSGEARTRPPERSMMVPVLAATALAVLFVGGAVVFVLRLGPGLGRSAAGRPGVTTTATATATVTQQTPATAEPASAAPPAASSAAALPATAAATSTAGAHATARPGRPPPPTSAEPPPTAKKPPHAPEKGDKPTPKPEDVPFE